jgi:hypothetical protein
MLTPLTLSFSKGLPASGGATGCRRATATPTREVTQARLRQASADSLQRAKGGSLFGKTGVGLQSRSRIAVPMPLVT